MTLKSFFEENGFDPTVNVETSKKYYSKPKNFKGTFKKINMMFFDLPHQVEETEQDVLVLTYNCAIGLQSAKDYAEYLNRCLVQRVGDGDTYLLCAPKSTKLFATVKLW